jgi:hypothetical protein
MRGRKSRGIVLTAHDPSLWQQITRSRTLPGLQVQRARRVLAMAEGERVQCDPSTL